MALFVASPRGNGHQVRLRALMEELEGRGWESQLYVGEPPCVETGFDLTVIDGWEYHEAHYGRLPGKKVAIIDSRDWNAFEADLVVNGSAGASHPLVGKNVLLGPRYALLRREFRRNPFQGRLPRMRDLRILGGATAQTVARKMASCLVILTYAGMRALEAAATGTPSVVVSRNPEERLNASGLCKSGAAIHAELTPPDEVAELLLDHLIQHPKEFEEMSLAGKNLVDGFGCVRVADAIEEICR